MKVGFRLLLQEIDDTASEFRSSLVKVKEELSRSKIKAANERKQNVSVDYCNVFKQTTLETNLEANTPLKDQNLSGTFQLILQEIDDTASEFRSNLVNVKEEISRSKITAANKRKQNVSVDYCNVFKKPTLETNLEANSSLKDQNMSGTFQLILQKNDGTASELCSNLVNVKEELRRSKIKAGNKRKQNVSVDYSDVFKKQILETSLAADSSLKDKNAVENIKKPENTFVETEVVPNLLDMKTKDLQSFPHLKEAAPSIPQRENCSEGLEKDNSEESTSTNFQSFSHHICQVCNKSFTRNRSLRDHHEISHLKTMVECSICKKKLYKPKLRGHMNKHKPRAHKQKVEEGKLKKEVCKICKRTFQWASFQSHVHIKNEIRYKCPTCGKIIRDYNGWKRHITLVHNGEKKYHCNICSRNFGQKRSLSRHISTIHIGSKPFLCEICSSSFGHIHNLRAHIKSFHDEVAPFTCNICSYRCSFKKVLNEHIDTCHKKYKKYQCSVCQKSYSRKGTLVAHHDYVHRILQSHACKMCNADFFTKSSLAAHCSKMHEQGEQKEKTFLCKQCDAKYFTKSGLARHANAKLH